MKHLVTDYLARHRNPVNRALHLIGLPVTFVLPVVLLALRQPWWALASFAGGYVLQFAGHAIEGNDAGETIFVKKLLGKPYVAVAPQTNAVDLSEPRS